MRIRKLSAGLICIILGIWFTSWRGHTPHLDQFKRVKDVVDTEEYRQLVRDNLYFHLQEHQQFRLNKDQLQFIQMPSHVLSVGLSYLVFFSAQHKEHLGHLPDIYMMQVQMGRNALPIFFTPPRNLTENSLSHDHLFNVDKVYNDDLQIARVLYGQLDTKGACRSITYLNWAVEGQQKLSWLSNLQQSHYYDSWQRPQWSTLRFKHKLNQCNAHFADTEDKVGEDSIEHGIEQFIVSSAGNEVSRVDVAAGQVTPQGSGVELIKTPRESYKFIDTLQTTLKTYQLITDDESTSLQRFTATFTNAFERSLYELFIDQTDPKQHRPVGEISSILDGTRPRWYPPIIDVKEGFPSEGLWRPLKIGQEKEPYILKSYIRLDKKHPYHSIQLYAFDMRRLGLHFVGAGDPTRRSLEGVGSGKIPQHHRKHLVAAFNGGNQRNDHGIMQDQHILQPVQQGLSTLLSDNRGRVILGRLDIEQAPKRWTNLRQSYAPLVDLRVHAKNTIPPQSLKGRLDDVHMQRSALGINGQGTLLYAWSLSATVSQMAQALRLVGVRFAMSLRYDHNQSGIATYPTDKQNQAKVMHSHMSLDPAVWEEGSAHDFFYLIKAQSLPQSFASRQPYWNQKEGIWEPILHQDIDPWIATSYLSSSQAGSYVELLRIDGERLQLHLALGTSRGLEGAKQERPLPAGPVARFPIGLGHLNTGLIWMSQQVQTPILGEMTWAVDEQGRSFISRWGKGRLSEGYPWRDVIQGLALVEDKKISLNLPVSKEVMITAMGVTENHDIIFASSTQGDYKALAKALKLAGAVQALVLNHDASTKTGQAQFFYRYQGRTFYNQKPDFALKPAHLQSYKSALIGIGDAFIITPKKSDLRARFVESFKNLLPTKKPKK